MNATFMRAATMPHDTRLRRAADFSALRRYGFHCGNPYFAIIYRPNALAYARFGMAVSRRVSRRAVERNRIKRILRESFRHMRSQLPPIDLLVIARSAVCGQSGLELSTYMDALWCRLLSLRPLRKTEGSG